jgi:hypothetical protein
MKYVDFLLQRDERSIRVKAVQSWTAEMFMSADGDHGPVLIVEIPVTVSPAHESELFELARTWLASIELVDVEIRVTTSTH